MKFEIFKYENVTSTNDVAINLIKEGKKEIGCVCANIQTKGRGTHGKKWISSEGNLFGSIFFPLEVNYPPFNEFSIINPVIISDVIMIFCEKKKISFKWPNDLFINGKKICGILQELVTSNEKKFLIIGIGLNIVSCPNINTEYQATNILLETKRKPSVGELIKLIIFSYEKFFINIASYNYMNFKKKADLMVSK
ncbi:MAG: biotin--[acetyl-CoA-carboxylase] ligase [Pelagibacteraceae bacterium]|jgi:BirA family biotin operon repressor/biotin-[acetyl-CoA-carboxylase] ligase|nr:biotin--[acetyl-CoA-carboxylase] ligase [Candidatus Pelagibacter sp.]MDP6681340.1 biotin--[acetyl-CoA-carboxylase] ligase [Pelagibacteraceae bacterium]|tara:strand:+ start:4505 stop:5089 length:585 start_codon:yes stop_codon:yes gene_type:complete